MQNHFGRWWRIQIVSKVRIFNVCNTWNNWSSFHFCRSYCLLKPLYPGLDVHLTSSCCYTFLLMCTTTVPDFGFSLLISSAVLFLYLCATTRLCLVIIHVVPLSLFRMGLYKMCTFRSSVWIQRTAVLWCWFTALSWWCFHLGRTHWLMSRKALWGKGMYMYECRIKEKTCYSFTKPNLFSTVVLLSMRFN